MAAGTDPKVYWIQDLLGVYQRQPMHRIPPNTSPLLVNISLDKTGSWAKRPGSDLLGTTSSGTNVHGLFEYNPNGSDGSLRAIKDGDIEVYTESSDSWSTTASSAFTTSEPIQSVQFLNRVYHVSESDYLKYETGGSTTTVGSGGNEIKGRCLAVQQNTLYVGGITYIGTTGAVTQHDRVYYSLFDTTNQISTHQLYESDPSQTMATSTRYFSVQSPITAMFAYGATGGLYVFTERECFYFDLTYVNNLTGPRKVFDVGCAGPNAITQCSDWMIWMSKDGRIWGSRGTHPQPLSWSIEDDSIGDSLIESISDTESVAAGSLGNRFWFSVGSTSFLGQSVPNTVISGLIGQGLSNVFWTFESYPKRIKVFGNTKIDDSPTIVFGQDGTNDVYQMFSGTNDGSSAIDGYARTKFYDMGEPLKTKTADALIINFKPQANDNTYFKISYAVDGDFTYTVISDPDGTGESNYGVVDMYVDGVSTNTDTTKFLKFPPNVNFRTISVEIANSQAGESFEIYGIGIVYSNMRDIEILPESS